MKRLEDRVAIVSGAGQGVGRGIALALAREGAAILIAELDAEKASRTTGEIESLGGRARAVATDVRHRTQVEAAVAAAVGSFGGVDILVNVLCPLAETPGSQAWSEAHPERARALLRTIPLGRLGDPETDIGRAVVFLARPDSDYVTGLTMMVDGGQTMLH